ncbi:hypothetical protein NL30_30960 [Burkholderia contaminans]|nr:hypothetical protein NL30_30960 [Burkholderia contaminans]
MPDSPVSSEHAQQLELRLGRHRGDRVEKQRAAVRAFEKALVLALRAREAAAVVAEHLALDQVRGDRAAVHREERAAPAQAQVVHGLRGQLLPGARFARQQHRCFGACDPPYRVLDGLHRGRAAEHAAEAPEALQFRAQLGNLFMQSGGARHAREDAVQPLHVQRLHQVVGRAAPQCVDRGLEARVSGGHHHFAVRMLGQRIEQIHPVAVRQHEIAQYEIGGMRRDERARFFQRRGRVAGQLLRARERREHRPRIGVVFDDQDVGHRGSL